MLKGSLITEMHGSRAGHESEVLYRVEVQVKLIAAGVDL